MQYIIHYNISRAIRLKTKKFWLYTPPVSYCCSYWHIIVYLLLVRGLQFNSLKVRYLSKNILFLGRKLNSFFLLKKYAAYCLLRVIFKLLCYFLTCILCNCNAKILILQNSMHFLCFIHCLCFDLHKLMFRSLQSS